MYTKLGHILSKPRVKEETSKEIEIQLRDK